MTSPRDETRETVPAHPRAEENGGLPAEGAGEDALRRRCREQAERIEALERENESLRADAGRAAEADEDACFRHTADQAPVLLWQTDASGSCVYVSAAWLAYTGRSHDGELGDGWAEAIHPGDRARAVRLFRQAVRTRSPFSLRYRIRRADGEYGRVLDSGVPQYNRAGAFRGYVGGCTDVTDQYQVQEELEAVNVRLREVLENALDASYKRNFVADTYEYLSPVFEHITGWSPAEVGGLGVSELLDLIHPDDRPALLRTLEWVRANRRVSAHQLEYRFRHAEGHYCWLLDRFSIHRDASGAPLAFIGSVRDITELRQAEDYLQSLHRLSLALAACEEHQAALELILDAAVRLFPVDCGGIYLAAPDGSLDLAAHRGLSEAFARAASHYPADAPNTQLAREGRTLYASTRALEGMTPAPREEGVRGIAVVPVMHDGQLLAVMNLGSRTLDELPPATCDILTTLAQQVGGILMRLRTQEQLLAASREVRALRGILPICTHCKKIRDDQGYWEQLEVYVREHSDAEFSHGLCPDCLRFVYPELGLPEGEQP